MCRIIGRRKGLVTEPCRLNTVGTFELVKPDIASNRLRLTFHRGMFGSRRELGLGLAYERLVTRVEFDFTPAVSPMIPTQVKDELGDRKRQTDFPDVHAKEAHHEDDR